MHWKKYCTCLSINSGWVDLILVYHEIPTDGHNGCGQSDSGTVTAPDLYSLIILAGMWLFIISVDPPATGDPIRD